MAAQLVQINVSVPEDRVADVYTFVAALISGSPVPDPLDAPEVPQGKEKVGRAANGFGKATVKRNYFGGVSEYWRPFLEALAAQPDEWVAWKELCEEIELDPKKASGMLGAAERRCKGYPPYYKSGYTEGDHWFLMTAEVAAMIKEFADPR